MNMEWWEVIIAFLIILLIFGTPVMLLGWCAHHLWEIGEKLQRELRGEKPDGH